MKIIFIMGWRNLWRNKRRSLVVISSISLGIFVMIFAMGFMNGFNVQMVENTIKTSLGHIAIHRKGFQDDMKLDYNFKITDTILQSLNDEEILAYAPRVKIHGMIRSSEASGGIMIVGIDPEKEKNISSIYDYTSKGDGSRFLTNEDEEAVLISSSLAKKLDLMLGDKTVLMFQDKNKEIIGVGMRIVGFFTSPIDSFDKFIVFTPIKLLQNITGLGENISEITIVVKNSRKINNIKQKLLTEINDADLEILSWKDMAPFLVSAVNLFDKMMYIFFMIIFITVIFSVANTLIMAIMERFHEIGVMKSIGTKPKRIFSLIMFEAFNLGIVGLASGIILGVIFIQILGIIGIDFSFYMESMRSWGSGSIIYPAVKTMDIVVATVIVIITTIIAALYPAVKAARIKPLDALHYV
ncbi:MAG: ABC transporter permease [Spirochaetes bacterium]|nr:ABC transporter permease [Spirochaetota bacterium]